jgi:hypothetical protein
VFRQLTQVIAATFRNLAPAVRKFASLAGAL